MGLVSDRCEINRQIKADNALLREIKAQVKKLTDAVKNTVPELANALESLRENMIVLLYRIRHIRTGKQKITNYVDAVKPDIDRYFEVKKEIKEKTVERKQLHAEQDALSIVQVIQHHTLSEQIATLTEDIEEFKSEKSMILKSFECADDSAFRKIKKNVENLETQKETLEQAEKKFTAELDSTLGKYRTLETSAVDVNADELIEARMEFRPDREQSASSQLQKIYGDKYDYDLMRQSKLEVKKMLGEDTRKPSIKEKIQRKKLEQQHPVPKKKKQKEYER